MSTQKFVERFDRYFGKRKDRKTQELRKYLGEYFDLIAQGQNAYVPRIYISNWKRPNKFVTNAVWGDAGPVVFPPTDFITLVKRHGSLQEWTILGYVPRYSLLKKQEPYLESLDGYKLLKKLSPEYSASETMEDLLEAVSKLLRSPKDLVMYGPGDVIPSLEEEIIYHRKNSSPSLVETNWSTH